MLKRTKLSIYLEIIAWIMAILFLIAVFLYYNVFDKQEIPEGYEIGEVCPDFEIEVYKSAANPDGGTFSPRESREKVIVLNFWYTNCGPCLAELPHFNTLQQEYPESVKVVAIHSYSADTWVDKQSFIDEKYSDYQITFALDTAELKLYDNFGGKESYPMTVILDKEGIIQYVRQGKIELVELRERVENLL